MYAVVIHHRDGRTTRHPYPTEREAWEAKDALHLAGFDHVQVLGAPMTGHCAGFPGPADGPVVEIVERAEASELRPSA